jgi:hypothetical protein
LEKKSLIGGIMRLSLAKKLLKIANELDALSLYEEANSLTNIVREAQTMPDMSQTQAPTQPYQQPYQQQPWTAPAAAPTPYNAPQAPYNAPYNGYAQQQSGWYNQPQIPLPPQNNVNPQQTQQQLLNMPASPFTAVRFGPDGKPLPQQRQQTMQEYVNNYIKSMQSKMQGQGQSGANNTIQNARQMQIQQRRNELAAEDAQLASEQYNQNLGDGHPKLYK